MNSFCVCVCVCQCSVGYRDRPADHALLRSQRRRDELVFVSGFAHVHFRRVRRLDQTVGRQRQHVQTDVYGPRVRHQRRVCEYTLLVRAHVNLVAESEIVTQQTNEFAHSCTFRVPFVSSVLPQRQCVCHGLRRCHVPPV